MIGGVLVAKVERVQPAADRYYTVERIDHWLRNWPLLVSLAETPRSSRHYLTMEHRLRRGPCPEEQRVGQAGGYHGDPLQYADILADIEQAWVHLKGGQRWSAEFAVVEYTMQRRSWSELAAAWRVGKEVVAAAYERALVMMAEYLGWKGEVE